MVINGLVYKSTGSWYIVKDDAGTFWNARVKGKMKVDTDISSTNPIAVGDEVTMEVEDDVVKTSVINQIKTRSNYIVRVSPHNRHQKHIIASNLDIALLIVTIKQPRTSLGFIDRFLITAEAYHIPAVIVVNKCDLHTEKEAETLEDWQAIYADAGYKILTVSATEAKGMDELQQLLTNKTTLFSGHSGVGKSTLINQLIPGKELRTLEVSDWSGKGQHTTTFAEMFDLPFGGRIIDTPGVKEFGLIDIEREELSHYFPEYKALLQDCKFNNCLHLNDKGCAIRSAVESGELSEERYLNYVTILDTIEKKW